MKVALIVPLHNQAKYWDRIVKGIKHQSRIPDAVYVVIDRPEMDAMVGCVDYINTLNATLNIPTKTIIIEKIPSHLTRESNSVFLAGYARNLALKEALTDGYDCFVFIDGDCIPQGDLIKAHELLCSYRLPVMSIARRRESKYKWQDQREHQPNLTHLRLFDTKGVLINNPELLKQCLIVWSCNMALNKNAVTVLHKFNNKYYGREEVFNSDFDGAWGGEDSFLGITAWYCRLFIHTVGDFKAGVEHIDHPRPPTIYNPAHKQLFDQKCDWLRKKIATNPIDLSLYSY